MSPTVEAVHLSDGHTFSKRTVDRIEIAPGIGVVGDAHAGPRVKHRSRVAADPQQPNLRQVHLIQAELFDEVAVAGHVVGPGNLGENITTRGLDLLAMAVGTTLRIGDDVLLALTGLRNPCGQIEGFQAGLLDQVRLNEPGSDIVRKAGVMAVAVHGGAIAAGDPILVSPPPGAPLPLRAI